MATVNLGAIKFNWKGAFNNSTAYAVDDVVSSSGSSYVCILASQGNAVSNGTYWNQMSSAGTNGTNGTDVGTTITTQGDILYRDASGLARLGYGTSGKVLTTKGSGQNPTWETAVGGKILQVVTGATTTAFSYGSASFADTTLTATITPSATSSKIFITTAQMGFTETTDARVIGIRILRGSTQVVASQITMRPSGGQSRNPTTLNMIGLDSPNTTSATTYKTQASCNGNAADLFLQQNNSTSTIVLMEIGA